MFLRLDYILRCGLFDEYLRSCTDRDLMIRLLDLEPNVVSVNKWTVLHYADNSRERLSNPENPAKKEGLQYFYFKYRSRMNEEIDTRFKKRSKDYFGVDENELLSFEKRRSSRIITSSPPDEVIEYGSFSSTTIICGVVTDRSSKRIEPLLKTLSSFARHVKRLYIVLLENDSSGVSEESPLEEVVRPFKKSLDIVLLKKKDQNRLAKEGLYPQFVKEYIMLGSKRMPIAISRTAVQYSVFHFAKDLEENSMSKEKTWFWILDDDKFLGDVSDEVRFLSDVSRLEKEGFDLVIGTDFEVPPLPSLSSIRTNLVDFLYSAYRKADCLNSGEFENSNHEDLLSNDPELAQDFYYDFSSGNHRQLEFPVSIKKFVTPASLELISKGVSVFRKPGVHTQGEESIEGSVFRGGNLFVFDPKFLLTPNITASTRRGHLRRSDFIFAILNKCFLDAKTVSTVKTALSHQRSDAKELSQKNFDDLWRDTHGHALYSSFQELCSSHQLLDGEFDLENAMEILIPKYEEFLGNRIVSIVMSFYRVNGIIFTLQRMRENTKQFGFLEKCDLLKLEEFFRVERILTYAKSLQQYDRLDVLNFLKLINEHVVNVTQGNNYSITNSGGMIFQPYRIERARRMLSDVVEGQYEECGFGKEGVCFTDKKNCFKVMDLAVERGLCRDGNKHIHFLKELVKKFRRKEYRRVNPIRDIIIRHQPPIVVLVSPFIAKNEKVKALDEVCPLEMMNMILEFRDLGVCVKNIKPGNILIEKGTKRLKYADFGLDVVPRTNEILFESMLIRGLLTIKYSHREDLAKMMRKNCIIPEIELYYENFKKAVEMMKEKTPLDQEDLKQISLRIAELYDSKSGSNKVVKILDYGCGKCALLRHLEEKCHCKFEYYGYDMKECMNWNEPNLKGRVSTELQFFDGKENEFDVVVCAKVLCCIKNQEEYTKVIDDLSKFVKKRNNYCTSVLISVCNPLFTNSPHDSILQERNVDRSKFEYSEKYHVWEKTIRASGNRREDVHRPIRVLKRDLLSSGLVIEGMKNIECIDSEFENSSDFLYLECRHLHEFANPEKVTLIIRSCFMECDTIYADVKHLVTKLEGPRNFMERILSVDCKKDSFLRQYKNKEEISERKYREESERLTRDGLIDRVVFLDPSTCEEINRKWFGVEGIYESHAKNGSPVVSTLNAIDQCKTPYFLMVDSDLLISRDEEGDMFDYIGEILGQFKRDETVVTISLNIPSSCSHTNFRKSPSKTSNDEKKMFRVECRAAVFHKQRLLDLLPFVNLDGSCILGPTELTEDHQRSDEDVDFVRFHPEMGWHRYLDATLLKRGGTSLRGGTRSVTFIHPHNNSKIDQNRLGVLKGLLDLPHPKIPEKQFGKVELAENFMLSDFIPKMRNEDYIFIICGYKLPAVKIRRCLGSIARICKHGMKIESSEEQEETEGEDDCVCSMISESSEHHLSASGRTCPTFGGVIINDGDDELMKDMIFIELQNNGLNDQFTVLNTKVRNGGMFNTNLAIRVFCGNRESVIITLDMDDALLNSQNILHILDHHYCLGHDVVVGNMMNTMKKSREEFRYPTNFEDPRNNRGGNVWKHLRTFKKLLYDRIRDEDLRDENGKYYDVAWDWSYTLPMVEMASNPVETPEILYFYEPSGTIDKTVRENVIRSIVSKPKYARLKYVVSVIGDSRVSRESEKGKLKLDLCEDLGEKLARQGYVVVTGGRGGVMEAVSRGAHKVHGGKVIAIEPSNDPSKANSFSDVVIPTGLDINRNSIVAGSGNAVIVVGGGVGTLSEFAFGVARRRLVVCLKVDDAICEPFFDKSVDMRQLRRGEKVFVSESVDGVIEILKERIHLVKKCPSFL